MLGTKENPQTGKSQKEQQAQLTTEVTTASQGKPAQSTITDGRRATNHKVSQHSPPSQTADKQQEWQQGPTPSLPADGEEQRGETSVGR